MRPSFDRTPGALPRLIRAAACACVLLVASVAVRAVAGNITIIRDTWGIPHVFSNSDEGAMFGAGYATAEDRLFQMHRNRRAVQGRLAELVGNMPGGSFGSTVQQDVYFRHHQLYKYSQRAAANLDVGTQRLLNAYCDGVNHYITTHAGQLHYLFAGQTPEPWTPADCVAVWNRMADYFGAGSSAFGKSRQQHEFERLVAQFGLEAAIEMFVGTPVVDESAAVVLPADLPQTTVDAMYQYAIDHGFGNGTPLQGPPNTFSGAESAKFSHAWVVAGARSTTGAALLHSDPQTAVASPSLFYELHVRGQTFDARGIGTAGCPGFLIGFNRRIAWGLTALGADMADLFELQSTGPNQYSYDGAPYMMDVSNEQILVRNGTPVPITVRDSIIGPVVTPLCQDVHTGEEFVLQTLPSHDAARHTVQGTIAMMRGETLATFIDALDGWRHPGANIVFGDDLGNIAYWTLAAIPVRSALAPVGPRIAQDGSASQYQWQETLPLHVRPHVINPARGAIWSGNHLPIGSWYPIPLALGTGGGGDTTRSWRLAERLAGSAVLSPADMLTVHRDDVNPARRVVLRAG
ncbi:MAG: penicillin acylase family protein [Phycisphaerae bacterium]